MRLRRIEAVRYGRLEGASLGNLGDKLTVVLGPNEAGKSTYTTLVRHILYGFPTPGAKEPRFLADGGKRQGRLVFESEDGAWVVERTEGPHGGATSIHTLRGSDHPSLLDEVRHGVSADAYRVVFGFGLAEMAQIEELRGKDDVVSRLYAAGAGLAVSPQDVRATIDKAAEELWALRGSARVANKLHAETRAVKSRLRELEAEAASYATDQERLTALESALAEARVERDAATRHHRELERDATALEEREREVDSLAGRLLESRRKAAALSEAVAKLVPDDRVLAVSAELDSLIADVSAHRERLQRADALAAAIESLDARIAGKTRELGLTSGEVPAVTPETAAMVEKWRETLSRTELQAQASERSAREATARVVAANQALAGATEAAGPGAGGVPIAAWVMLGVGFLSAAAGLISQQYVAVAAGALLVAVGAVLALWKPLRPGAASSSANAVRSRDRALDAQEAATAAAEIARTDADAHAAEVAAWRTWLPERELDAAGEDPAGVATYLAEVRALSSLASERDGRTAEAAREREAASEYASRLARTVAAFMPDAVESSPEESLVLAERARQSLAEARDAAAARVRSEELLGIATEEVRKWEEEQRVATQAAEEIISAHGIENGGLGVLRALEDAALADARRVAESVDALTEEAATLRGELRQEGRESEMGDLRLELTSLEERTARAAADYAVLAVASRLLVRAQERYERERQPEVVRTAEAVFARITDGRYTGLTVPLGGNEIRVFGQDSSAHATAELSRGTAEQMYLALRIGLIEQLGDVGSALPVLMDDILVNFDPERREGAALAIRELANARQVVVFTCHPETAEVLSRVAPERELLELSRCDL